MVIEFVLDASAVLARLHDEPGAEIVRAALPTACMSAVNYAEAISKLIDEGLPFAEAGNVIDRLYCEVIEADKSRSALVGSMRDATRRAGASMGDRFCLQLGRELGVPVLTTDRRWKDLDVGVEVVVIR